MNLIVFKVSGLTEDEYGAIRFAQSKDSTALEDLWVSYKEDDVSCLKNEDEDWKISIKEVFLNITPDMARKIRGLIYSLADDDWIGDYDGRKSTDVLYLLTED